MKKFRSWKFVAGVVFLLATVSFRFGDGGVQWLWADTPVVAVALGLAAAAFLGLFVRDLMTGQAQSQ